MFIYKTEAEPFKSNSDWLTSWLTPFARRIFMDLGDSSCALRGVRQQMRGEEDFSLGTKRDRASACFITFLKLNDVLVRWKTHTPSLFLMMFVFHRRVSFFRNSSSL